MAQIKENPYLQYFLGFSEFKTEAAFDQSLLVHFQKRLGIDESIDINEIIAKLKSIVEWLGDDIKANFTIGSDSFIKRKEL